MRWYRVALLATMPKKDQTERSIRSESRDSGSSFSKRKTDRKKDRKKERQTDRKKERKKERNQAISFFGSCLLFSISVLTHLPNLVP